MSDFHDISNRSFISSFSLSPRYILNEDYPVDPKTFGEKLRKARMDAGLMIKELAALVGVTEIWSLTCKPD